MATTTLNIGTLAQLMKTQLTTLLEIKLMNNPVSAFSYFKQNGYDLNFFYNDAQLLSTVTSLIKRGNGLELAKFIGSVPWNFNALNITTNASLWATLGVPQGNAGLLQIYTQNFYKPQTK